MSNILSQQLTFSLLIDFVIVFKNISDKNNNNNNNNNNDNNNNNNNDNNNKNVNNNNDNNNNNKKNNANNNSIPVTLNYQVGVWWGIVVSHGQEGLFSLGWKPS